jgi:hypothetical protein
LKCGDKLLTAEEHFVGNVQIDPLSRCGALFHNYKQFYDTILIALVNAKRVDVRKNGCMSETGIIKYTTFYQHLSKSTLNLPGSNKIHNIWNYL